MSIPGESTNIGSPVHPSIPPTPCSPSDEWTAIPVGIEGDDLSKSTGRAVTQRAFNAIKEYLQCDLDNLLLQSSLAEIDRFDESIAGLEQAASELDNETRLLGNSYLSCMMHVFF
ncbi:hypothetical protein FBUS_01756 [Fasciolopsis buskii]|uniref:Uncharacterized protein n=1 Tax=Fasciolopsis buskii TaxID=27845 RepID=A0A8E0VP15_9TREM|nr:hypothetical protein FBUS_01756 [Fasciolopsis buski]